MCTVLKSLLLDGCGLQESSVGSLPSPGKDGPLVLRTLVSSVVEMNGTKVPYLPPKGSVLEFPDR